MATILFGLIEWIREKQFNEKGDKLENDWSIFWDTQPMKGLKELNDPNYDANLIKEFKAKHKTEKRLPSYHLWTWIIFIIYLLSLIFIYLI